MSREANIAQQQKLGDLVNAGAFDRLGEVFGADAVDHDPAPGQSAGAAGFQQFFETLGTAFPDAHLDVETLVADEDNVAFAYTLTGTHQGDFQGISATGKPIKVRGLQIGRFDSQGMLVERWGATDELGMLQQIGAQITP